jgi:hypothetical protein
MDALTPASPDSLPPLGALIADELFWRFRAGRAGEGVAQLRVWTTTGPGPGHLAAVTETGSRAAGSAPHVWAGLARWYGPSLVLLEHHPGPGAVEGAATLDLVRVGADGSPQWTRIWPAPADNPRHAGLEIWMATYGHQIVSGPASWLDRCGAGAAE